jgi:hypothetical protein
MLHALASRWRRFYVLSLLNSFVLSASAGYLESDVVLRVNVPLFAQTIALDDVARYRLERMQPSTTYEVRISFPASVRPYF